jgi:hypothetical protein
MSDEIQYTVFGQWWVLAAAFSEIAPLSLRSWKKPPLPPANDKEPPDYTPVPESHTDGIAFILYATIYDGGDVAAQRSLGRITFTNSGDETQIAIVPAEPRDMMYWRDIMRHVQRLGAYARDLRRGALSQLFTEILDDYYDRKARGESPNLRERARAAGVKEGSLRQAKVRYDQQRRKQSMN